jgi:hypothetical protein
VQGRKFKQSFYVLAGMDEDEDDIIATIGIPQVGTLYRGAVCLGHDVREISPVMNPHTGLPGVLCEVVIDFDNDVTPDDADQPNTDPENRRARVNWTGELEDELLERDAITGDPIETPAHEAILVTAPTMIHILEITRYETWPFNPLTNFLYGGKLNSAPFYDAPIGTAWLQPIEAPEEELEGSRYVHATYRVKFKIKEDPENPGQMLADTWKMRLLCQGQQFINQSNGKVERNLDDNGDPVKTNLSLFGRRLGPSEDPEYLLFNRLSKTDLNDLNLGPFA